MALTKPKLSQNIDTDISVFTDPILVLHQGSTLANVDTGFLFNRANGLVSNVALYWSESANTFVAAFTTSTGAPDANVSPTQFANIRLGTATANTFQSNAITITGIANVVGNLISSNVQVNSGTAATSTSSGALVVQGGVGISGTLYTGVLNINGKYQFPTVDGVSGQALVTNGTGILTFANVSGGGSGGAAGFPQSTVTTFPTGDYGTGEGSGIGTGSPTTDAFEVPLGALFDTHEPRGSSTTVDLNI
jgi:hypothetical protein